MKGKERSFRALGELLKAPKARDRMGRLFVEAELLAELANVNTRRRSEADYVAWDAEVRDTALEFSREVKKEDGVDESRLRTLHNELKAACTACHDRYQ
jgi:hypothetical protein